MRLFLLIHFLLTFLTWRGFSADLDNDGLSDEREKLFRTDPRNADTDGDGLSDGWEAGPDRYEVVLAKMTWDEAYEHAKTYKNGHLVTITGGREQWVVEQLMNEIKVNRLFKDSDRSTSNFFIGGTDSVLTHK